MNQPTLASKLIAEFIGTFFLIAAGVGIALSNGFDGAGVLAVALVHGLALGIAITGIGHISGGHLNPAVTFALTVYGKIKPVEAVAYIVAQLAGAYVATLLLWKGFDVKAASVKSALPTLADKLGTGQGILLEAIATFILVWTVFAVAVDLDGAYNKLAGLPIGFAVTVGILMIGTATGGALNPARWFGPALLTTTWSDALVWIVGPLAGGVVAGGLHLYGIKPRLEGVAASKP